VVLDAVVAALLADPRRTYNMAEVFFFDLWLQENAGNSTALEAMATLIAQGRFNFVNGGCVCPQLTRTHVRPHALTRTHAHTHAGTHARTHARTHAHVHMHA